MSRACPGARCENEGKDCSPRARASRRGPQGAPGSAHRARHHESKMSEAASAAPLFDHFVGDLHLRYVFDDPKFMIALSGHDLKRLGVAREELVTLATANFRRLYPKLSPHRARALARCRHPGWRARAFGHARRRVLGSPEREFRGRVDCVGSCAGYGRLYHAGAQAECRVVEAFSVLAYKKRIRMPFREQSLRGASGDGKLLHEVSMGATRNWPIATDRKHRARPTMRVNSVVVRLRQERNRS